MMVQKDHTDGASRHGGTATADLSATCGGRAEVMRQALPEATFTVDDVVGHHRVAVQVTVRGTHRGEFLGIASTGGVVEYVSQEFYRFVDGRVAEEWICSDMWSLHGQLTGDA